jgi:hypothetical protein
VRSGVVSSYGPTNNVTAIETDMRDVLRERKARLSDVSRGTDNDYSAFVSGISVRSVQEIDHLIEGLQGLREKLNNEGDHLHRQIAEYGAFSQSVIELTVGTSKLSGSTERSVEYSKIVSDGMASVNKSNFV